jgi:hypothetical protein
MSLLAGVRCWAAIITVDPNGSADYTTIQAGINAAVSGQDTVIVAEGTYVENISFGGKNIILTSTDPDDWGVVAATIIDGNDLDSVVRFDGTEDPDCVLSGFTITGGNNTDNGGGIYGAYTEATVSKCIVKGNIAQINGGGLQVFSGIIDRCMVFNNFAGTNGGGLAGCQGKIINCLVYGNSGGYGVGLNNCDGDIVNCTVVDNTATNEAGGLRNCDGTITNCIIWGNNLEQITGSSTPTYSCIQDWSAIATIGCSRVHSVLTPVQTAHLADFHPRIWTDNSVR